MHGVVGEGCKAVHGVEGHRIDVERVNYHHLEANLPTRGDEAPKGMHKQLATNTSTGAPLVHRKTCKEHCWDGVSPPRGTVETRNLAQL